MDGACGSVGERCHDRQMCGASLAVVMVGCCLHLVELCDIW